MALSVQLSVPIAQLGRVRVFPNDCQNLVGVREAVDEGFNFINRTIPFESCSAYRKTLLMIARCPRGGKTTILAHLHHRLRDEGFNAMSISFNGGTYFRRLQGESASEALFRIITNQLDLQIDKNRTRNCDWKALDDHIGHMPFVLLIDDINILFPIIEIDLALILKKYFINKENRCLVVSSHHLFLENAGIPLWSDCESHLSMCSLSLLNMPESYNTTELTQMNEVHCAGITRSTASFYGGIPSLMYATAMQPEETPAHLFSLFMKGMSKNRSDFEDFVTELVTGIAEPSVRHYLCFSSGPSSHPSFGILFKWPLCFVQCIMNHYRGIAEAQYISECIDVLCRDSSTAGDGIVLQQSIRIAILLRFVLTTRKGFGVPFQLCEADEVQAADIQMVALGEGITTIQQAHQIIRYYARTTTRTTLVLFYPVEASFAPFDGFCALFQSLKLLKVCGYRCDDNNKEPSGTVPDWVTQGGHLLRSQAPRRHKTDGPDANGWTHYNETETNGFLGWTLRIMHTK